MTKKYVKENFYDEYAIKKEDTIIAIVDSGTNARKICNELNALNNENKQLKQAYNDAKKDVEKKEQILEDIMKNNLLIQIPKRS